MKSSRKREALNEYLEAKKDLEYWAARVAELEPLNLYRSPSAGEMPTGGGGNIIEAAVVELETAREKKEAATARAREAMWRVLALIEQAPTADQRAILRQRYITGMNWEDIAAQKGKTRTWATNLHGTAIKYINPPEE